MKLEHTPGKWYVAYAVFGDLGVFTDFDVHPNQICAVQKSIEDARLIAAAPEMLDYLISEARDLWTQQRIDDIGADELRLAPPIALVESATGKTIEEVLS